ncbi:tRNA (adenosine(37)-N6)-threonylcarbamoyltransferase complex ATPase subunit type 1 TsaE, partial [Candidatus Amoebophilus asiaticus]|nr:tRNA (adenosine(37)-N6)-threonylcarbamoyltransferase complex ATPase subunit type 1 TsaE [Candidatus Amoebophilus asiaticus]
LFYGELGVGKTTFIKAICSKLGVTDLVNSPTFAIVNEYQGEEPIYHLDFYRIKNENEVYDIGFEEYLKNGYYCFIEWPSRINNLLPENAVRVYITNESGVRTIKISKNKVG